MSKKAMVFDETDWSVFAGCKPFKDGDPVIRYPNPDVMIIADGNGVCVLLTDVAGNTMEFRNDRVCESQREALELLNTLQA